MDINITIGTTNQSDSNEFLKSLWAQLAEEFGKCAWQYMPTKKYIKDRIFFGHMDIDSAPNKMVSDLVFAVSITYAERGTIKDIFFDLVDKKSIPDQEEVFKRIEKSVSKAKGNVRNYTLFGSWMVLRSMSGLSSYKGERFSIETNLSKSAKVNILVESYDINQSIGIGTKKINQMMDFLSVETNAPFWFEQENSGSGFRDTDKEVYQEDPEFIDGLSSKDNFLIISKEGKKLLEKIVSLDTEENKSLSLFLKACHHFHTARRYNAQIENIYLSNPRQDGNKVVFEMKSHEDLELAANMGGSHTEIATTLYLSALEVVTLHEFQEERCETCGQPRFKIKQRVKEFVTEHLNEHIAKLLSDCYDKRSFYLHRGSSLTHDMPTHSLVPLLDKKDSSGCVTHDKVSLINLREYTSYCLRKFYKKNLL